MEELVINIEEQLKKLDWNDLKKDNGNIYLIDIEDRFPSEISDEFDYESIINMDSLIRNTTKEYNSFQVYHYYEILEKITVNNGHLILLTKSKFFNYNKND